MRGELLKIGKYLRISLWTVPMIIFCCIYGSAGMFFCTYAVMLLHEMAHLAAAVCLGLDIDYISVEPFGINLNLKNTMLYSLSDEIILYISGPCANIFFALTALFLSRFFDFTFLVWFYISNIMLFCVNMLPVLPLDGGMIVKRILCYKLSQKTAGKIMRIISVVFIFAMLCMSVYMIFINSFNFSVIFLAAFLAGNIFSSHEKYNEDFIRTLAGTKSGKISKVRVIRAYEGDDLTDIGKEFVMGAYTIICFMDKNGKIKRFMSEEEATNKLLGNNCEKT